MKITIARAALCTAALLAIPLLNACQSDGCIEQPDAAGNQVCVHLPSGGGPDDSVDHFHERLQIRVP